MFGCSIENIGFKKKGVWALRLGEKTASCCVRLGRRLRRDGEAEEVATCPSHLPKTSGWNVKGVDTTLHRKLEVEGVMLHFTYGSL